jgi:hypothetical protein
MDELIAALENCLRAAKTACEAMQSESFVAGGPDLLAAAIHAIVDAAIAIDAGHATAICEIENYTAAHDPCANGRN